MKSSVSSRSLLLKEILEIQQILTLEFECYLYTFVAVKLHENAEKLIRYLQREIRICLDLLKQISRSLFDFGATFDQHCKKFRATFWGNFEHLWLS